MSDDTTKVIARPELKKSPVATVQPSDAGEVDLAGNEFKIVLAQNAN